MSQFISKVQAAIERLKTELQSHKSIVANATQVIENAVSEKASSTSIASKIEGAIGAYSDVVAFMANPGIETGTEIVADIAKVVEGAEDSGAVTTPATQFAVPESSAGSAS